MPELTVVLPVLNGARYLAPAVTSTLRALPPDAELLVVDDGSTDATPEILERHRDRDRRIRVLRHERPGGVAAALNAGLAATDSRYLARMDADDVCLPTRFRRQLRSLRRLDFVFGSSVLIDDRGRVRGASSPLPVTPRAARYHLLIGNFFSHPTMACRRQALADLGGYADTPVEDFELWLRAVAAGYRTGQSPLPAIAYRLHDRQITHSWSVGAADPVLDRAYARLLPGHLRGDVAALRAGAATRSRTTVGDRAAWQRLEHWIRADSARLPPLDRAVLRRRLAQHAPRSDGPSTGDTDSGGPS